MKKIKTFISNKRRQIIQTVAMTSVFIAASVGAISADGPGVDPGALQDLINGFVTPIKDVLIWVVPTVAAIGALILGIRHFFKNEQEQEEFDLMGKLVKLGIVAAILQSIAIVFKIFGVA